MKVDVRPPTEGPVQSGPVRAGTDHWQEVLYVKTDGEKQEPAPKTSPALFDPPAPQRSAPPLIPDTSVAPPSSRRRGALHLNQGQPSFVRSALRGSAVGKWLPLVCCFRLTQKGWKTHQFIRMCVRAPFLLFCSGLNFSSWAAGIIRVWVTFPSSTRLEVLAASSERQPVARSSARTRGGKRNDDRRAAGSTRNTVHPCLGLIVQRTRPCWKTHFCLSVCPYVCSGYSQGIITEHQP